MDLIVNKLAEELNLEPAHVEQVVRLLDEGNTIPFIARYRKELHGGMEDTALRAIHDRLGYLRGLEQRREEIRRAIDAQEKLTPELETQLNAADTLARLEDLYRPYRPKRRTRATMARERGLAPLAETLLAQEGRGAPETLAEPFVDEGKGVDTVEAALAGASDIVAETVSDDADSRDLLRDLLARRGALTAHAAGEEDSVYRTYYDYRQPLNRVQGHQVLAINRGEREGFLKVAVELEAEPALARLQRKWLRRNCPWPEFLREAVADAYHRLIFPALCREVRSQLTEAASEGAIQNFAANLKPLLLQPPVRGRVTLGLDPGYVNGCKAAVVDPTGKVLDTAVLYLSGGKRRRKQAVETLHHLVEEYHIQRAAVGNGTGGREAEQLMAELIRETGADLSYAVVSEAGASVYSVSPLASEELGQYDVNLRSAVSIARRLQDPLAELVKIDPKSIGVGQYQHDMPAARLDTALVGVVEDCVNAVGVDVNTASAALLTRVAGLNGTTAKNIVKYREENGRFTARKQLLKVPKLGPKAFQQCAGFLRVPESGQILDNTGVHPESYGAAEALLARCGYTLHDLAEGAVTALPLKLKELDLGETAAQLGVGEATLRDIAAELCKPGRDPREELPPPMLRTDVLELKDLRPGMELTGTVRNVVDFGAFVDIGVHHDGLVHISQLAQRYISNPREVVDVGDVVQVAVLDVDVEKKRISLSMKDVGKGKP
jgi:uncharacterized protein